MKVIIKTSVLLMLFTFDFIIAQDTLLLKNNTKLPVNIIEVGLTDIIYKFQTSPDDFTFSINKTEVENIIYSDGFVQKILINDTTGKNESPKKLFLQGQVDAARFYKGYRGATTSTLIVSLISPIVGLIPAIVCSKTNPKPGKLSYPDPQLFHKTEYQRGYLTQSKRIKSKKVWRNWGIALAFNVAFVVVHQY
jgi:hypothetical protein